MTNHNNRFKNQTPDYWEDSEIIKRSKELIEQRKIDEDDLHEKIFKKSRLDMKVDDKTVFNLSDVEDYTFEKKNFRSLNNLKLDGIEGVVIRVNKEN